MKYLGSILDVSICLLNSSGDDEYKKLSRSKRERLIQLKFSHCMHISQILCILYVADGVQTNQEAEAKKTTLMEKLIYFFKR